MAKGDMVFTPDEMNAAYPPRVEFFTDGEPREIVILSKELAEQVSKKTGKPYTTVDWEIADAHTGEKKAVRFDFAFTNALHPHKKVMRFETSVFKITPTKVGERNGYSQFEYWVEYLGEDGNAPIKQDEPIVDDVSKIDF
jgi:hypothetical protein